MLKWDGGVGIGVVVPPTQTYSMQSSHVAQLFPEEVF